MLVNGVAVHDERRVLVTEPHRLTLAGSHKAASSWWDGAGAVYGYLLARGRFKTIDVPGFTNTMAWGINDSGQIVGGMANAPPPRATSANTEQAVPEPMSPPVGPVEGRP